MKPFISIALIWIFALLAEIANGEDDSTRLVCDEIYGQPVCNNETVHLFLLVVRDSAVNRLHLLRQDGDEGGVSFAQTGMYIGQIVQGVLGGDLRPIFAGSVKFIEQPTAQQNLGNFLGTIAPTFNLILRGLYTRGQVALGLATTPKAATPSPFIEYETGDQFNSTLVCANGTCIVDYDTNSNSSVRIQQQKQKQQSRPQSVQVQPPAPAPTTAWQYVLNQILQSTTTVEPLPLITRAPAPIDNYDNYEEEGDISILDL